MESHLLLLFTEPSTMSLFNLTRGLRCRSDRPVRYEIQRALADDPSASGPMSLRPLQLTLVLDPVSDQV